MAEKISKQVQLTGAYQTVHTVDSHRWLTISLMRVTNVTGAAVTVRVCHVPPTGTPGISNAVLYDFAVDANTFWELGEGDILEPNWTIQALASAVSSVVFKVSGIEDVV